MAHDWLCTCRKCVSWTHWEDMEKSMKKNGYDYDECCYEEMTKGKAIGQSALSEYWDEPMRNSYEMDRKGYNANGLDQSGMKK